MTLSSLIARVEGLNGPDREVDAEIAVAVDGGEIVWLQQNGTMEDYPARKYASTNHIGGYGKAPVPEYTASIDAAMTLVPEGWNWGVWMRHDWKQQNAQVWHPEIAASSKHGDAETPAIALTAACLRARDRISTGGE